MAKQLRFEAQRNGGFTVDDGQNPAVRFENGVAVTSEEEGGWLRDIVEGKVPGRSVKGISVSEVEGGEEKPKAPAKGK